MRFMLVALSAISILISVNAAKADRRVAFVVGNGAYKNVQSLPNPAIDAKSMARVLRNVGFDVVFWNLACQNIFSHQMLPSLIASVCSAPFYRTRA